MVTMQGCWSGDHTCPRSWPGSGRELRWRFNTLKVSHRGARESCETRPLRKREGPQERTLRYGAATVRNVPPGQAETPLSESRKKAPGQGVNLTEEAIISKITEVT